MTRDEAIEQLQICKDLIKQNGQDYLDERDIPLLDMAIEALSAERTGEWIKTYIGQRTRITCSNCGQSGRKISDNFCPNCGARMVGDNDEK